MQIFPNRTSGLNQSSIYLELAEIRNFRNRVAHYEPICFDASGKISTGFALHHYGLIRKYIEFMGVPAESALRFIEKPDGIIQKLDDFK